MSDTKTFQIKCIGCKQTKEIVVPLAEYRAWQSGKLIQEAMPNVSANDRELIISRTCPECWAKIFSPAAEPQTEGGTNDPA